MVYYSDPRIVGCGSFGAKFVEALETVIRGIMAPNFHFDSIRYRMLSSFDFMEAFTLAPIHKK